MKKYKIGYTTGVFDMFHIGHLNILRNAKEQCEYLIVGVSTDEVVKSYKHKTPIIKFEERIAIVESIKYVDKVVAQTNMNKLEFIKQNGVDVVFVGSDWKGTQTWIKFEEEFSEYSCDVVYLSHTEGISSTILRNRINFGLL